MSTRIQTDQACEHVVVDAVDATHLTITVEPDRHGLAIKFEGFEEQLVIDLSKGVFTVYRYLDELMEKTHHIVG